MVAAKKKIKDYIQKSMRKLKHRKGFGVHSPFAYSIITEVIEEKLPYYAYRRMQRSFDKSSPVSFKAACLLLRLANRFRCRNAVEVGCDGGYSILPLIMTDSRLTVTSLASGEVQDKVMERLSWLPARLPQVRFVSAIEDLDAPAPYDIIVVNTNPFETPDTGLTAEEAGVKLADWVLAHATDDTVICVHGIQPRRPMEFFWDSICDRDEVSITMDLFDYGLAILKPRFFKQHYIVSF